MNDPRMKSVAVDQLRMVLVVMAVIYGTSGTQYIIQYIFTRTCDHEMTGYSA